MLETIAFGIKVWNRLIFILFCFHLLPEFEYTLQSLVSSLIDPIDFDVGKFDLQVGKYDPWLL